MSRKTDELILERMLLSSNYTEKDCQIFAAELNLDIEAIRAELLAGRYQHA